MTALPLFIRPSILTLFLYCGFTFAQPASIEPLPAIHSKTEPELNEGIAYLWLLGATAVPMMAGSYMMQGNYPGLQGLGGLLFAGGLFAGPSAGQFYAGANKGGAGGIGLRVLGAALSIAGVATLLSDWGCQDCENSQRNETQGSLLLLLGTISYVGGNLYSIIDTHFAVQKYNEEIKRSRSGFLPILKVSPEGQLAGGGRVWLSF